MPQKQILTEGEGSTPLNKQMVSFKVTIKAADNKEVVCHTDHPQAAVIGHNDINPVIEQRLLAMKAGEKATFFVSKEEVSSLQNFQGVKDKDLTMQIHLLEVGEVQTDDSYLTLQEREEKAGVLKQEGNSLIKDKKYSESISKYQSALQLIEYQTTQQSQQLQASILLNLALASMNNKQYEKAVEFCQRILREDPCNLKAIYRKASSQRYLGQCDRAETSIKRVLSEHPQNQEFLGLLKELKQQQEANRKKEKQLYSKMFGDS